MLEIHYVISAKLINTLCAMYLTDGEQIREQLHVSVASYSIEVGYNSQLYTIDSH